jgi:hypothetical protein
LAELIGYQSLFATKFPENPNGLGFDNQSAGKNQLP